MERKECFASNGTRLYGTLTLPKEERKSPACLFIGGSFPQTRDGDLDNPRQIRCQCRPTARFAHDLRETIVTGRRARDETGTIFSYEHRRAMVYDWTDPFWGPSSHYPQNGWYMLYHPPARGEQPYVYNT